MPARPAARQRLADLMERRRLDLGLTWREVAEAGNISYEVIRAIRNGNGQIRPLSKRGIEVGLKWEAGSVQAILDDGDPQPVPAEHAPPPAVPELPAEPAAESAEDIGDAVVTVLRARQGEPGVWAELRDYLAGTGLLDNPGEASAWPPGGIPVKLTPRAEKVLNDAAEAGVLFRDAVGATAARIGSYPWHLRVRMIAQLRETMRNPTQARRAG
jgi:hypothetical protein